MNIAILHGGNGGEQDVSFNSAKVVDCNLKKKNHNTYLIHIDHITWTYNSPENKKYHIDKNDFSLNIEGEKIKFDCVFNAIHGDPGENGRLAGYLEMLDVPFTSSGSISSCITFHKDYSKTIADSLDVPIAKSCSLKKDEQYDIDHISNDFNFPLFVKPCCNGSSIGVSKVKSKDDLKQAIEKAFKADNQIMVEEAVIGKEVACSVYELDGKVRTLPLTDIIPQNDFFDYQAKYEGFAEEITPANVTETEKKSIEALSILLFNAFNCKGFARVDYIITKESIPYFIEVNSIPGLSEESILPQQLQYKGIKLEDFFNYIVMDAIKRK
ncbi:MAG: D-alanine--D-alanine ligase [Hyphomicrobiales bacterium]